MKRLYPVGARVRIPDAIDRPIPAGTVTGVFRGGRMVQLDPPHPTPYTARPLSFRLAELAAE